MQIIHDAPCSVSKRTPPEVPDNSGQVWSVGLGWRNKKPVNIGFNQRSRAFLDGGAEEIRTPDPHNAIVVLYQLSYDPIQKRPESSDVLSSKSKSISR